MTLSRATFRKSLIVIFFGIAVATFVYELYLDNYYSVNGPSQAMAAEGRIYRRVVHHGTVVFLTERELFNLNVLFPSISIGSVLIGGLFALRWRLFGANKQKPGWPFVRRRPYDFD
jgi:hypothetical protein